jgi:3-hydroxyisobutyrate dehydrogenase-like beta-hydroxyacid dehydrogenase
MKINGILSSVHSGHIAIDMSTLHPETTHRHADAYAARRVAFLEAPVFGSNNEAQKTTDIALTNLKEH